ncbi:MAG: MTH1187 family thiamine-binding protein [Ancrocorticia sp.]|uniref:MTH1187 family thiamine-binding protein n=1 Tax=Ancrocorticia sp. TaxID=2593684 RepID=UPI003F92F7EE
MLLAFSIAPQTTNDPEGSVAEAVSAAIKVVRESGLSYETTSMFTTLEGEWDEIMAVIKKCVDAVEAYSSRVSLVMKADIRPGYTEQMTAKVDRVNAILEK